CDRSRARAPVRLQDITVERDRALAQRFQVDHRSQGTADQALNLERTPTLFAADGFAPRPCVRRARQHAVLGGHPSAPCVPQERWNDVLRRGRAQHPRIAALDQDRAFGMPRVVTGNFDVAQLICRATARSSLHDFISPESDWMLSALGLPCRSMMQGSHVLAFSQSPIHRKTTAEALSLKGAEACTARRPSP